MKWTDWIIDQAREGGERLGASFAKLLGKRAPSDATAQAAADKLRALLARHQDELAQVLDEIPGVPTVLATMAVGASRTVLDAGIAGALEGYQAAN